MRVAIISEQGTPLSPPYRGLPGAPTWPATELALALAEQGDEVRLYARRDAPGRPDEVPLATRATLRHVPAGPVSRLGEARLLRHTRLFGERVAASWADEGWAPDVIHAHYWLSGLAALVARRSVDAPVVLTFQGLGWHHGRPEGAGAGLPDRGLPDRVGFERQLGRAVDRVISHSRAETSELIRLGIPRGRIAIIPLGVDPARFAPHQPLAPRLHGPARIVMVGTAGELPERKGYADAIRALRLVPGAELVVVGGPAKRDLAGDEQARRLRSVAERAGVPDRVRLVGRVPREEIPGWYHAADLVTSAAWYGSFGITAVESMAAGVPVVATEVGGYPDTVVDGLTGALVPPRRPEALGHAIRRVLSDPIRRVEYAAAGLDRVRQVYSWDRVAAQVLAEYRRLRLR